MSFPYPQDRNRDRREKGEHAYKEARQTLTEAEASLQAEAEAFGESRQHMTAEERQVHLEEEAEESMRRVGADFERSREKP